MKCPFCVALDTKVVDSRLSRDGEIVRRRRECEKCARRFTTYERVEELLPLVVKKDGRREAYARAKAVAGLTRACIKRPIGVAEIEAIADRIERSLQERAEKEVPSSVIGEEIMRELLKLDEVSYVRFVSVYRQFNDLNQFMEALRQIQHSKVPSSAESGPTDSAGGSGADQWK